MTTSLRFALAASLLLALSSASAQTTFSLHNPTLVVDGNHIAVEGAPLSQYPFTYFYLSVPEVGTYTIAGYPFEGARKAGTFNDTYFEFTAADHQIQIWSTSRLLSAYGIVDAYVRFDDGLASVGDAAVISSTPISVREASAEDSPAASGPSAEELRRGADARRIAEASAQRRGDVETARLEAGRVAALQQRNEIEADRMRLQEEVRTLRREVEELDGHDHPLQAERDQLAAELARLQRERGLESAIAGIRSEMDHLRSGASDLANTQASLESERSTLRSRRTDLVAELSALRSETEALESEIRLLRSNRERLTETRDGLAESSAAIADQRTSLQEMRSARDEAAAERDEYAQTAAGLRREKTELEAGIRDLEEQRAQLMQERLRLMADRDQVVRERDALHRETERLRNEAGGSAGTSDNSPAVQRSMPTTRTASIEVDGTVNRPISWEGAELTEVEGPNISLHEFDFSRLENPREVHRFIEEVEFPQIAQMTPTAGNVLVLFSTDEEGWVVQTEVTEPIGSGLDIVAEQIVRTMHFKLQSVVGHPATMSSHVTVAFNR